MDFESNTHVGYKKGKKRREHFYIEPLYYPAVDPLRDDSWLRVLGKNAFLAWLQMQTLVDRSDEAPSKYGNKDTVPRSIDNLAKTLRISRTTLYDKVLKVLWDYALIDFEEWKDQKKAGQKAINILVYEYPQNNPELRYKPLTKVRNYETDYHSKAKTYNNPENKKSKHPDAVQLQLDMDYEAKWAHDIVIENLKNLNIKESILRMIQYELSFYPTTVIPLKIVEDQLKHMEKKLADGGEIFDFAKYFVGGIIYRVELMESIDGIKENTHLGIQVEEERTYNLNTTVFYDWLNERE